MVLPMFAACRARIAGNSASMTPMLKYVSTILQQAKRSATDALRRCRLDRSHSRAFAVLFVLSTISRIKHHRYHTTYALQGVTTHRDTTACTVKKVGVHT